MLGAIAGDIVGSVHEWTATKTKDFPLFVASSRVTDETILTLAVAECLIDGLDYAETFHRYFEAYPGAGYTGTFVRWAFQKQREPYRSFGNAAAARVTAIAYAFDALDHVLEEARHCAGVTHDHPDALAGAQAVVTCVFLARNGATREEIRDAVEQRFGYLLAHSVDELRVTHEFDSSTLGSIPQAIRAFLDSTSVEDAIRNAVSLGGDADTMASVAGAIAEPFYGGLPLEMRNTVLSRLDPRLRGIYDRFKERHRSRMTAAGIR